MDDFTLYPLFTDDLIHVMRTLIPREQQASVATSLGLDFTGAAD